MHQLSNFPSSLLVLALAHLVACRILDSEVPGSNPERWLVGYIRNILDQDSHRTLRSTQPSIR